MAPSMLVTAVKLPIEEETPGQASLLRPPVFIFAGGFSGVGLASHDDLLSVRACRALAPNPVFAYGEFEKLRGTAPSNYRLASQARRHNGHVHQLTAAAPATRRGRPPRRRPRARPARRAAGTRGRRAAGWRRETGQGTAGSPRRSGGGDPGVESAGASHAGRVRAGWEHVVVRGSTWR